MATRKTNLISGKIGFWVWYVVNGKQRIRALVDVYNPQSPRQMEIRSINTELSRFWREELTEGQRIAWAQRAEGSGMRAGLYFIRQNFKLLDFALPIQITPPPMISPPELTDLVLEVFDEFGQISVPQMTPGTVTAQAPFLDVEIAGGFTEAQIIDGEFYEAEFRTEALSQGRKAQQSDYRHVFYLADKPIPVAPQNSVINFLPQSEGTTRNYVIRITRYNKFGTPSGARVYQVIGAAAPL